jgi:hypothetical protein
MLLSPKQPVKGGLETWNNAHMILSSSEVASCGIFTGWMRKLKKNESF